jgi:hypothetical protein
MNERAVEMVAKAISDWGTNVAQHAVVDSSSPEMATSIAQHIVHTLELDTEAHAVKGPIYRGYTKIVRLVGPWFEP